MTNAPSILLFPASDDSFIIHQPLIARSLTSHYLLHQIKTHKSHLSQHFYLNHHLQIYQQCCDC
jgi:hypothetical protein